MRVIVTRPERQSAKWVRALAALGCPAEALPLIRIAPLSDVAPLQAAWRGLADCSLVMFVSANAVQHFFAQAVRPLAWPAGVRAGSTGPGTTAALRAEGLPEIALVEPAADAPSFDSEALWARLAHEDWSGRRVLVVRGEDGRDWLADTLRERGARVDYVAAYRRLPPQPGEPELTLLRQALQQPADHLWVFSSSEAIGHLQGLDAQADWSRSRALATHPRIAAAARDAGFAQVTLIAPTPAAVAQHGAAGPSIQSQSL